MLTCQMQAPAHTHLQCTGHMCTCTQTKDVLERKTREAESAAQRWKLCTSVMFPQDQPAQSAIEAANRSTCRANVLHLYCHLYCTDRSALIISDQAAHRVIDRLWTTHTSTQQKCHVAECTGHPKLYMAFRPCILMSAVPLFSHAMQLLGCMLAHRLVQSLSQSQVGAALRCSRSHAALSSNKSTCPNTNRTLLLAVVHCEQHM